MPGVVSTTVGYTGGKAGGPTYRTVCSGDGHTEAIKVEFDPAVISYEELMRRVVTQASTASAKAQYKSAIWGLDAEQEACAIRVASELGKKGLAVLPATTFHDAEEYHRTRAHSRAHTHPQSCCPPTTHPPRAQKSTTRSSDGNALGDGIDGAPQIAAWNQHPQITLCLCGAHPSHP